MAFEQHVFGFLYASRFVTNSKIYGSLGLVPVFMVGLYFSWAILLFGAQVAYAFQNRKAYLQEKLVENVNQRGREFIALRLMTSSASASSTANRPPRSRKSPPELGVPTRLVATGFAAVARRAPRHRNRRHTNRPTCPRARSTPSTRTTFCVPCAPGRRQDIATRDEPARAEVLGDFAKIEEAERAAASSVTLLSLVNRAQKQIEDTAEKLKSP